MSVIEFDDYFGDLIDDDNETIPLETTWRHITICRDGVIAGCGWLDDGIIRNCGAVWDDNQNRSEEIYEAIENAIANDCVMLVIDGHRYSWEVA